MIQTFCPIYREASESKPWTSLSGANSGLVFEKFGDAWQIDTDHAGVKTANFDKGGKKKEGAGNWLSRFTGGTAKHGDVDQLAQAIERQHRMVQRLGGKTVLVENDSRFVTGMGRQHPLENGFTWHHTLGTPFLPGTSVKGMLRSWARESKGEWRHDRFQETDWIEQRFGVMGHVGDLIIFDMLPLKPVELVREIMTPHYSPYYQKGEIPGDWHSPVPISFLAVESGQTWQLGIAPGRQLESSNALESEMNEIIGMLVEGLQFVGVGAKTAIGMGRFTRRSDLEESSEKRRAHELAIETQQQQQAAADAKLPEEVRSIVVLARSEKWLDSDNSTPFLDGLERFLQENASPSVALIEWLRDTIIESGNGPFEKWKGIWADPNAMGGKKKNKPKFKGRIKDLVLRLKELSEADPS